MMLLRLLLSTLGLALLLVDRGDRVSRRVRRRVLTLLGGGLGLMLLVRDARGPLMKRLYMSRSLTLLMLVGVMQDPGKSGNNKTDRSEGLMRE